MSLLYHSATVSDILQDSMQSVAIQVDGSVCGVFRSHDAAAMLHGAQKIWNTSILSIEQLVRLPASQDTGCYGAVLCSSSILTAFVCKNGMTQNISLAVTQHGNTMQCWQRYCHAAAAAQPHCQIQPGCS